MKASRRFKITVEDESRLQDIASFSLSPLKIILIIFGGLLFSIIIGYLFVLLTPAKNLIPGYFRASQRAASEQALLRVDSLMEAYRVNEAYMANLREVFDVNRVPEDTVAVASSAGTFSPDSLMPASAAENRFAAMMQDREKFNIVKASIASEGMLFYPISEDGIVTSASRNAYAVRMVLPANSAVAALADGVVLASYYDPPGKGYSIIMQHDNGFVSRYSSLRSPLVKQSESVAGGKIIALSPLSPAGKASEITVELWHDGIHIKPYEFISRHHRRPNLEPESRGASLEKGLNSPDSPNSPESPD